MSPPLLPIRIRTSCFNMFEMCREVICASILILLSAWAHDAGGETRFGWGLPADDQAPLQAHA